MPTVDLSVLTSGGDERSQLDPRTSVNQYFVNPLRYRHVFDRGTCTTGMLNPRTSEVASAFIARYPSLQPSSVADEQAQRLRATFASRFDDGFEVFFAPSGSDLSYWPLIFQRMLHPSRPIATLHSCWDEIGNGSRFAAQGRFHTNVNQFGDPVLKDTPVSPACRPELWTSNARDDSGAVTICTDEVRLQADKRTDAAVIATVAFGTKTGLKDDVAAVIDSAAPATLWVVDLCQLRLDADFPDWAVERGALLMVTGSKFFQAPPFCGALLVPRELCDRLRQAPADFVADFDRTFSAFDVPVSLPHIRDRLPSRDNPGLRTRWEVALDEIERFHAVDQGAAAQVVSAWSRGVRALIEQTPNLRLAPGSEQAVGSIIAFHVLSGDEPLPMPALRDLYERVVRGFHTGFSGDRTAVSLGQPVGPDAAPFLRVAIGASTVHELLRAGSVDLADDCRLLEIVSAAVPR